MNFINLIFYLNRHLLCFLLFSSGIIFLAIISITAFCTSMSPWIVSIYSPRLSMWLTTCCFISSWVAFIWFSTLVVKTLILSLNLERAYLSMIPIWFVTLFTNPFQFLSSSFSSSLEIIIISIVCPRLKVWRKRRHSLLSCALI